MTRGRVKFIALGVGVYLAGLLVLFPASIAVNWAPQVPGLALGAASGTLWQGKLDGVNYRGLALGSATWSLHPLSLLGLAVAADVTLDRTGRAPLSTSVRATPAGLVEISALRGGVTLAELARAGVLPANIATGDVILDLDRIVLDNGRPVAAEGRGGLVNLRSTLLPGINLGSFEGEIQTTDAGITATFRDVEAPLRVAGQAQVRPDGSYDVSGAITPVAETPEALRRGLALLGQPDASGQYSFRFGGRL